MANGHFGSCTAQGGCACEMNRYKLCLGIVGGVFVLEALGAKITGSLALWADAGHVLMDSVALLVTIVVTYCANRDLSEKLVRKTGGLINSLLLGATSVVVFREALHRFSTPHSIKSLGMIFVALVGAVANYGQHQILEGVPKDERHLNHRLLDAHILSDLWLSVAVILGGVGIALSGNTRIDSVLSMIASGILFFWSLRLGYESFQHGKPPRHHDHP